jgi:plasmid stabilization system protein ParE
MPANKLATVEWTERSIKQASDIQNYLADKFTEQEVSRFYNLLTNFEKTVVVFPKLYPEFSVRKKLRRAVLNKNLSVYYAIRSWEIIVVSVLDNRMDYSKML